MPPRRLVRPGESYTIDEEVDLEEVSPMTNPPPEETRGEPWGWTKPGPRPLGWREDGNYDGRNRDHPGPFDGRWEQ